MPIDKVSETNEYPAIVNVTLLSTAVTDPWRPHKFPFTDNKLYLQDLAKYVWVWDIKMLWL